MLNLFFELDRLRQTLLSRGFDSASVETIVANARIEIMMAFEEQGANAMTQAIEVGVEKRSADFINELRLDSVRMELATDSGNLDFHEPPFPMLPHLLKNAKPMKDGSGVYKVIPVGETGKPRTPISNNIYDAWKRVNAQRAEAAKDQYSRIAPKGSKTNFKTATSKQSANTQWVIPARDVDFTQEVQDINSDLQHAMSDIINDIIDSHAEGF